MKAARITLKDKYVFFDRTIKFLEYITSKEGFQIDPEKVKAIVDLHRLQNISEQRSLLDIANQVGEFAKNQVDTTQPLWDLLRKVIEWIWDESQKTEFQILKK